MRLRLVVPADVTAPTGGNTYDLRLADALRRAGDVVEVVPCDEAALEEVLYRAGDGVTLVDGLLACRRPAAVEAAARRAAQVPRGRVAAAGTAAVGVGVLVHMPLALDPALPADEAAALDAWERRALTAARVVVATSRWSAEHLAARHGLRDVAVAVARPGADPAPVCVGSDPPLLVHLAALLPHKNQLGLVAALARLRELPWRARLAGSLDRDLAYATEVRAAIRSASLEDRVEVPGELDRDAAWEGADLALLPSRAETFGMVVTEALARGVPALVTDGGPAEALGHTPAGERPGMVVPVGDTDALEAALRRWLDDPGWRDVLRERALVRRGSLEGWDATARCVREALVGR